MLRSNPSKFAFRSSGIFACSLSLLAVLGCVGDKRDVSGSSAALEHLQPASAGEMETAQDSEAAPSAPRSPYPTARMGDVVDVHHGIQVPDPYRWLEDTDSAETRAWVDAQNELTHSYLRVIPERGPIAERLTELWTVERFGVPVQRGKRLFFTWDDGVRNQPVLCTAEGLEGEQRTLLDPNSLSRDGTIALAAWQPSEDGRLLAYSTSDGGSDWRTWHVLDVESGQTLPEVVPWSKFGDAVWDPKGLGFYYMRFPEPDASALREKNESGALFYHRIGTDSAQDREVYRCDDPLVFLDYDITPDGRTLVITHWHSQSGMQELHLLGRELDGSGEDASAEPLITGFDARHTYVGALGDTFWIQTDWEAPNGRVIAVDRNQPEREAWQVLIPEGEQALQSTSLVGPHFVVQQLVHAQSRARIYTTAGEFAREIKLPGTGTAAGFEGRLSNSRSFFSFESFTRPREVHWLDAKSGATGLFRAPDFAVDLSPYTVRQVFYESVDGTRVPMFLAHRKDLEFNGSTPTYLHGYGGFNVSLTPRFGVFNLAWMEMGGVYAQANLRGGGEYGEPWHEAGTKLQKQNVFDDFIAAARHLIDTGITEPDKLAIAGGSNGGLLVGACLNQAPELYAAGLPAVGVMDMLRFHKFTIGWAWVADYGSPEVEEEFRALHAYSPLHNLREGHEYPAVMITTADHDDRVVPGHSFKYAARLQACQAASFESAPALIRIENRAGHGAGKPRNKSIEEAADKLAFLVKVLDMTLP